MKRFFTKTGIELTVVQGECQPQFKQPKLKPGEFSLGSMLSNIFSNVDQIDTIKPASPKRYCLGYDATTNSYFIDDRVSQSVVGLDYSNCLECCEEIDRLNKADETAV